MCVTSWWLVRVRLLNFVPSFAYIMSRDGQSAGVNYLSGFLLQSIRRGLRRRPRFVGYCYLHTRARSRIPVRPCQWGHRTNKYCPNMTYCLVRALSANNSRCLSSFHLLLIISLSLLVTQSQRKYIIRKINFTAQITTGTNIFRFLLCGVISSFSLYRVKYWLRFSEFNTASGVCVLWVRVTFT